MANDVKWIKIVTDIFDDEKIQIIDAMPEHDAIIVIWFKLLCLAGKQNNSGVFGGANCLAYNDEMFAAVFHRPLNTIRMAMQTFEQLHMVEKIDDVYTIPNWEKHQSLDAISKKQEYDREYQRRRRQLKQQKVLELPENRTTIVRQSHDVVSLDIDKELEGELDKEGSICASADASAKPTRHKYGRYENVLLSDEDMVKLKQEFPTDWEERIERLSEYIASKGAKYKNHLATIRAWARKDKNEEKPKDDEPPKTKWFFAGGD